MKIPKSIIFSVIENPSSSVNCELNLRDIKSFAQEKLETTVISSKSSSLLRESIESARFTLRIFETIEKKGWDAFDRYFFEKWNQIPHSQRRIIVSTLSLYVKSYLIRSLETPSIEVFHQRQTTLLEKITHECFINPNISGYWTDL